MISGDYYFHDDLKYEFNDWKYCTCIHKINNIYIARDRRFYQEHLDGIKPSGGT
jgi:hypothetical protein